MLTNEEIGILSRILDKADTVYRSSIVYEENGAFNTLAFIDRLYFTSSVEALSIALNKDFMKEDGDEVNRFYSRNYDRILKETEETMGNVSTAFDRVRKNGLKEGKESAREENREYERGQYRKGYEEGRKDAVIPVRTAFTHIMTLHWNLISIPILFTNSAFLLDRNTSTCISIARGMIRKYISIRTMTTGQT